MLARSRWGSLLLFLRLAACAPDDGPVASETPEIVDAKPVASDTNVDESGPSAESGGRT